MSSKIVGLILQAKNKLSAPVEEASKSLDGMSQKTSELERELAKLEGAQVAIDSLDDVKRSAIDAEKAFDATALEVIRLKAAFKTDKTPGLEIALDKAKVASRNAKKEWQASAKTLQQLEARLQRTGIDLKNLGESQKQLTEVTKDYRKALAAEKNEIEKTAKAAVDASRKQAESGQLVARIKHLEAEAYEKAHKEALELNKKVTKQNQIVDQAKAKHQEYANNLKKVRDGTSEVAKESKKAGISVKGFIGRAAGFLGVYAVVNKIQNAFSGVSRSVYESGIQFEKLGARLSDLELDHIEKFAREVPFQLAETADAFAKLKTFGIDPMNGSLQAIADQTAALGGGQEELNGIVIALGQAWGKQKLQQEEVLQLVERGVPAWDLLSKATGRSTVELQKMSTAGQLGRREIKLLIDEMGKQNVGAAAKQMSTLAGLVSNLQDRFTQFARMIADAGVFDYLKKQASELIAKFKEMANNGELEKLAKKISDTFINSAEYIKSFVKNVYEARTAIIALGSAFAAVKVFQLAKGMAQATKSLSKFVFGAGAATTVLKKMNGATGLASKGFGAIARNAKKLTVGGLLLNIGVQFVRVGKGVRDWWNASKDLDEVQQQSLETQKKLAEKLQDISKSTGVAVTSMADLERQIKAGNIVIDEQSNQYLNAEQAADLYMQRQREVSDVVAKVVFDQDKLSESMKNTSEALKDATADNSKLAGVLNDQLLLALQGGNEGVLGFSLALRQAEQQSDLTSRQINEGLVVALDKLSDEERLRFGEQIKQAMLLAENSTDGAAKKIEYLQRLMDSLDESKMSASLKRLGIEQAQLTNEITLGVEQSLKDLTNLDQQLSAIGGSSDNSVVIFDAIKKSIAGIKTEADALALAGAIDDFKNQGSIAYDQYEDLKNQIAELDVVAGRSSQWLADRMKMIGEGAEESGEKIKQMAEDVESEVSGLSDSAGRVSQDIRSVASGLVGFFHGIKNSIYELSAEAGAAFDNKLGIDVQPVLDEIESLQSGIDSAYTRSASLVRDSVLVFDAAGINKFKNTVLEAQSSVEIAYNSQKLKFLEYVQAIESGENINKSFLNSAENSINNMNLLGQEDLSELRGALDSANQKLQQMSDNAENTLNGLQNELDRIQGNQDAIEERDYERKRAELNAAIEDAQLRGNKEAIASYTEALKVLGLVKKERQSQAKENTNKENSQSSSSSSVAGNSNASTTTINLQSPGGGKSVQSTGNKDAVDQLLDVLADANMRAG